jgi:pimeloyl-ACP methyl ester carboxylesterase
LQPQQIEVAPMVTPFTPRFPASEVEDLKRRLAATRFPPALPDCGWERGIDRGYLAELVEYWAAGFSWPDQETRLARFPQFRVRLGENDIHFVHVRGKGPAPYPLILTHGWPSSFLEFLPMVERLTDPAAAGGSAADSFDLVIPSLPGFGFSQGPLGSYKEVAALWSELMTKVLGYERFGAHGGDIGAGVTSRMGLHFPRGLDGIHVLSAPTYVPGESEPTQEERDYLQYVEWWTEHEGGYHHQQRTRPRTLGVALNDSPAGLAAWIAEKWQAWIQAGMRLDEAIPRDDLLANITLYWLTGTATSSMEMYWHNRNRPSAAWGKERVGIPARLLLTTEPVDLIPESAARRCYADLSYARVPRGGHFLAAEQPETLADDLRTFFRGFRPGQQARRSASP